MNDYDPRLIDTARRDLFAEVWEGLVAVDGLTVAGLQVMRAMLDPYSGVFLPRGAVADLALAVDMRLAEKLDVPLSAMPGHEIDGLPDGWA